jgi:hypothetical protein
MPPRDNIDQYPMASHQCTCKLSYPMREFHSWMELCKHHCICNCSHYKINMYMTTDNAIMGIQINVSSPKHELSTCRWLCLSSNEFLAHGHEETTQHILTCAIPPTSPKKIVRACLYQHSVGPNSCPQQHLSWISMSTEFCA